MFSIKNVKTKAVVFSIAGTIALSSFLGPVSGTVAAATNLAPTPSFESASFPNHWTTQQKSTDAMFVWNSDFGHDGDRSMTILGSKPSDKGWPGIQTTKTIPVDSEKEYVFTAWNYSNKGAQGSPWMDISLYNSAGKYVGGVSTGTSSVLKTPGQWHKQTLSFKPAALSNKFPDITSVKLGLRLSLNKAVGKKTGIIFDQAYFGVAGREPVRLTPPSRPSHPAIPRPGDGDSTVRPGSKPHIPTPVKPKLTCMGMPATIVGTEGDDMLRGTPGNDVILGLGGNDRIYGLDGNDILCGGDGNDLILGGPGHDRVLGERGMDRLYGGRGNDQMRGGAGMDRLYGHGGDDTIAGGYHNDYLNGGTGNDRLFGNDGGDRLDGGAGRDYLNGGADHDGCINGERYVSCNP